MLTLAALTLAGGAVAAGVKAFKKKSDKSFLGLQGARAAFFDLCEDVAVRTADVYVDGRQALRKLQKKQVVPLRQEIEEVWKNLTEQAAVSATKLDTRYQQFVFEYIDPMFGSKRNEQLEAFASGPEVLDITPYEKGLNRDLGCSFLTMGTALAAYGFFTPLYGVSLALTAYITRVPALSAYRALTEEKRINLDFLVTVNLVGTFLGGYFLIGGAGLLLFFLSEKLVIITQDRSRKGLINVFGQQPRTVWVLIEGVEVEIPFEQLRAGDQIVVHAGQTIPVDGVIIAGMATVDQHALTGEAQPAEKAVGDRVFAATLLLAGNVQIQVEKAGEATMAAQIGDILNNTAGYQMAIQSKGMQLANGLALPTLALGVIAWPLVSYQAFIAILGTCIGFNIKITGPIAMLNFLNISSTHGILIKDGRSLELLHTIDTVVFDKTGTLTLEQPHVVELYPCGQLDDDTLLCYAAAAEHRQSHPIAQAIIAAAAARGLHLPAIEEANYEVGYGIRVQLNGHCVRVGSDRYMALEGIAVPPTIQTTKDVCHQQGHSLVMVAVDDRLAGAIELQPTLRPEAKAIAAELRRRKLELVIISGDQEQPTRKLAQELGIDRYFANTLPENKAALVEQLQADGHAVCFVGDGINDAIALKTANVSISLRGATTAATDTAQIVLMAESLRQLPFLYDLGDEFNAKMRGGFAAAVIPGVLTIGGAYLGMVGIAGSIVMYVGSLLAGLGVASLPLLGQRELHQVEAMDKTQPAKLTAETPPASVALIQPNRGLR